MLCMIIANVYELECCLRLLYHYAETCVHTNELNESHAFVALLVALHDAQILQHPHEQVMLAYYELMMKYGKYCPLLVFHSTLDALLQSIQTQHKWSADRYHIEVRSKCVNFANRLMESAHLTNGYTLLGIVEQRMPGKYCCIALCCIVLLLCYPMIERKFDESASPSGRCFSMNH